MNPTIYFVHPDENKWQGLDRARPAELEEDFLQRYDLGDGGTNWVIQTYFHLVRRKYDVSPSRKIEPDAINVIHNSELSARLLPYRGFVVAVRADYGRPVMADRVILQNKASIQDPLTDFFIPHWPQPGLRGRDAAHSERFTQVAYMGQGRNLHPYLRSDAFAHDMENEGFRFRLPARPQWHDYRDVDAVVSVRPETSFHAHYKPASKLINAWLTGVLPIMGEEDSTREAGLPGVDFHEVRDPGEVLPALIWFRDHPEARGQMMAHGRARSLDYTVDRIADRWWEVLDGPVRSAYARFAERSSARRAFRCVRFPVDYLRHRREQKCFWKTVRNMRDGQRGGV